MKPATDGLRRVAAAPLSSSSESGGGEGEPVRPRQTAEDAIERDPLPNDPRPPDSRPRPDDAPPAKKPHPAPIRILLIIGGWISIVLGIIGALLPIVPTTPFLLLALACFSRSSPRFQKALLDHHIVGPPLRQWVERGTIPHRARFLAIGGVTLGFTISISLFIRQVALGIGVAALGLAIVVLILRIPGETPPRK